VMYMHGSVCYCAGREKTKSLEELFHFSLGLLNVC